MSGRSSREEDRKREEAEVQSIKDDLKLQRENYEKSFAAKWPTEPPVISAQAMKEAFKQAMEAGILFKLTGDGTEQISISPPTNKLEIVVMEEKKLSEAMNNVVSFDEKFPEKWEDRWPYFKPFELFSPSMIDGGLVKWYHSPYAHFIDPLFLDRLTALREALGVPLMINDPEKGLTLRGFRTVAEQKIVQARYGGAEHSMHTLFRAADVTSLDASCSLDHVALTAEGLGFGGIGIYRTKNFVHVDTRTLLRGQKAVRWEQA